MNCKCVGKLTGEKWSKYLDIYRRVYDPHFLCPTIHTVPGGNTEIKIIVKDKRNEKNNI